MPRTSRIRFRPATEHEAAPLAALHTAVADTLTRDHGRGPWSTKTSDKGILLAMRRSKVYVAIRGAEIVATFQLSTRKPWAIDTSYFTECRQPLYLLAMAVRPTEQRRGLGKRCFDEAVRIARAWPADAIRLDAYDSAAGAGNFYASCGCAEKGRVTYRNAPLVYFEFLLA